MRGPKATLEATAAPPVEAKTGSCGQAPRRQRYRGRSRARSARYKWTGGRQSQGALSCALGSSNTAGCPRVPAGDAHLLHVRGKGVTPPWRSGGLCVALTWHSLRQSRRRWLSHLRSRCWTPWRRMMAATRSWLWRRATCVPGVLLPCSKALSPLFLMLRASPGVPWRQLQLRGAGTGDDQEAEASPVRRAAGDGVSTAQLSHRGREPAQLTACLRDALCRWSLRSRCCWRPRLRTAATRIWRPRSGLSSRWVQCCGGMGCSFSKVTRRVTPQARSTGAGLTPCVFRNMRKRCCTRAWPWPPAWWRTRTQPPLPTPW